MIPIYILTWLQPALDSLVHGTPTESGNIVLQISNLLGAAILTYLTTKLATKFPFIRGGITVALGAGLGALFTWLLSVGAAKLGFPTGLTVKTGGLASFIIASGLHEYLTNRPAPAVVMPA